MAERGQWVRRWERSGQSRVCFAREHGLCVSTLVRWMAEQARRAGPAVGVPAFREVPVSRTFSPSPWVAEVQRPDGCVVRLGANVPEALVQLLVSSRPC